MPATTVEVTVLKNTIASPAVHVELPPAVVTLIEPVELVTLTMEPCPFVTTSPVLIGPMMSPVERKSCARYVSSFAVAVAFVFATSEVPNGCLSSTFEFVVTVAVVSTTATVPVV